MGERGHKRHRVFVEDARRNGSYLRATWHPERRLFTISTWTGEVCTGAVRLPAAQATEIVSLMVDGLAELATPVDAQPEPGAPPARRHLVRPSRRPAGGFGGLGRSAWGGGSPLDGLRRWLRSRQAAVAPAIPLRRSAAAATTPAPAPAAAPAPSPAPSATPSGTPTDERTG